MTFALLGNIITQSGGSTASRDDPSTLSTWAAANGLAASVFLTGRQLTIQGGYRLHINGFYQDTGYSYDIAANSRIRFDNGCDWESGELALQSFSNSPGFQGIAVKGAKWNVRTWTSDESFNLGAGGKLRWYGVDINSDITLPVTGSTRADFILTSASLDAQLIDCSITSRGNHRIMGGPSVKATGCFFGFGPFYFNGDLSGFANNTIGSYVTGEVRCNIDNGRTMSGATLKFPLTTTNWVLNLGATTDVRTYRDLGLPSTLNYSSVSGYQGGIVKLTRSVSLPVVAAESTGTSVATATVYRQELGAWVAYPVASFPATLDAYVWKWTDANFAFRVAQITEDRRLCDFRVVDYARQVATGQIDVSNAPYTGKVFMPLDTSVTQANQATVAAYTAADSAAKAYDLSKLWMINNYSGQTAPSLSRSGTTISTVKTVVFDPAAEVAYAETTTTVTLKANSISMSVIGNVTQATPTNLTGVTITGNLTYNTNTPVTITLTNCTIAGTVSNSGTGAVSVNLVNSTITAGANVTAQYPITIMDADGKLTSFQVWVFNAAGALVYDSGFQSQVASVTVNMPVGGSLRVYSQPYGYISRITSTADTSPTLKITHIPETLVDTTLDTATRNEIESHFSSVIENNILYVETDADFAQYTPAQVLNGMHYFIVNRGFLFAAASLAVNSVGSVKLIDGGFRVYSAGFKGRAKSTLNATNTPSLSITLPLYIDDASGVPGNQVLVRNANGIAVVSALWTKAAANITNNDMVSIAAKVDQSTVLAKKTDLPAAPDNVAIAAIKAKTDTLVNADLTPVLDAVATRASQTSVSAIPTNPVLATDARLGNLDAAVSTRLAANAYTAPSAAPTPAQNAAAMRTELAAELSRMDVAVSTRLASTGYTAPDNTSVAAIKAKTDALTNGPSAADIKTALEASGSKLDKAMKAAQAAEDNTL